MPSSSRLLKFCIAKLLALMFASAGYSAQSLTLLMLLIVATGTPLRNSDEAFAVKTCSSISRRVQLDMAFCERSTAPPAGYKYQFDGDPPDPPDAFARAKYEVVSLAYEDCTSALICMDTRFNRRRV